MKRETRRFRPEERGVRVEPKQAFDLPSMLAYLLTPIMPMLRKIKVTRAGKRGHNPRDILLPEGYVAEVVATGLNAPVHITFDNAGNGYITECGHKIDSPPRIRKVSLLTGGLETVYEFPRDRWIMTGAVTGAAWHDGHLYVMNTDTLSRIKPDGTIEDLVTGLPGRGDHQANHPLIGPDGKIYFGMGCATNCAVVGADNAAYEWLPKFPDVRDVPAKDITLTGRNYAFRNVLGDLRETVATGAFVPFGTETTAGQVIKGNAKASGAILRCSLTGKRLEVVAWGLRNPYGIAFHPDGRLFCTEHGMDERGGRFIVGDFDDFYEIKEGEWYGWPDYASGVRLDDPFWGNRGQGREPVIANPPNPNPPKPVVMFQTHAAANGFDFCRDPRFGFEGDAFVALFGDIAPITTARLTTPVGFKVVRVDMRSRRIVDFAVNRIGGPASKLPHEGFERPSQCAFGPDGALYVVDWGEIEIAPEAGGIRMQMDTGTLWRIRRIAGPRGERPPEPMSVPFYLLQYLVWGLSAAGVLGLIGWLVTRPMRRKRRRGWRMF